MYELKEIPGFENYFIDNEGNVFSNKLIGKSKKRNFKQLKAKMCKGYGAVSLSRDKICKTCYIHRLVALTFIGEPSSPELVVNHKDGNKLNNTPENLEWVTQKENVHHYWANLASDRLERNRLKTLKLKEEKEIKKLKLKEEKELEKLKIKEEKELEKLKIKEEKELEHKIICLETKEIFKNQIEAAAKFNVTKMSICKCVKFGGKCCGFHLLKYTDYLKIF